MKGKKRLWKFKMENKNNTKIEGVWGREGGRELERCSKKEKRNEEVEEKSKNN